VKGVVNATPVDTTEELAVRIHRPHRFDRVRHSLCDGVMNVIRFRVDALNTFCKLSAKFLEVINEYFIS
jgi:hypothetical protein